MPLETYETLAETTTTADPGSGGTTLAVTNRSDFPQAGQFRIVVQNSETDKTNREVMLVTGGHGTGAGSFTVTRDIEGPGTNVAHASGSYVYHPMTAASAKNLPMDRIQSDYYIFKEGSNYYAKANRTGLADVHANSNAAAVLQSCLDNINSTTTPRGTIVFAPNTTFVFSTTPLIRRTYASGGSDDGKLLRIYGSGNTEIQFANSSSKFFQYNRIADYDGFFGLEIAYFVFNGTGITWSGNIIGTRGDTFDSLHRGDMGRLEIHHCNFINLPTYTTANGNYFAAIWLQVVHPAVSEATRNYMTDISLHHLRIIGGNCGIAIQGVKVGGLPYAGLNIYGDRWYIGDVYYDDNVAASAHSTIPASSCIHVGGGAFGERIIIERCWLSGSGDDGIETNNFRRITVRDCHVSKTYLGGYAPVQFNYVWGGTGAPANNDEARTQVIVYDNCHYEHLGDMEASAIDRAFIVQAYGVAGVDSGAFIFRNCVSYCSGKMKDNPAQLGGAFFRDTQIAANVDRVIIENCMFDTWYDNTSGSLKDIRPVWMYKTSRETVIRNLKMVFRGTQTSGTYAIKGLYLNGAGNAKIDINGLSFDDLTTSRSAFTTQIIYLGNESGSDLGGAIRAVTAFASSDTAIDGIFISGTSTLTLRRLWIEEQPDFSRLSSFGQYVKFASAPQNEPAVLINGVAMRRKRADQLLNGVSAQPITDLQFAADKNEVWRFECQLYTMNTASDAGGIKVGIDIPTGATLKASAFGRLAGTGAAPTFMTELITADNTLTTESFGDVASTPFQIKIEGTIVMGSTAGNVTIVAGEGTAGDDITVQTNSTLAAQRF